LPLPLLLKRWRLADLFIFAAVFEFDFVAASFSWVPLPLPLPLLSTLSSQTCVRQQPGTTPCPF
jgi:hypothetical protein